ncbi:hypothetical protein BCR33DRAFT_739432 [Rhizoclosmatium globosum]|uniref:Uncharacterized protein n=1 Tax=Rhizoclosmatium globosum TaxID=329046 RepID=A0A1Y2C4D9_9FUNG|nr:hypothetical protein BCR33DRAFT_739432 [Rhizoclosmatium globosum]|eukprot:ORY41902.1 hypothetical protein BCR33DRAFT_739432 [Rhizoclosmatium globosum]
MRKSRRRKAVDEGDLMCSAGAVKLEVEDELPVLGDRDVGELDINLWSSDAPASLERGVTVETEGESEVVRHNSRSSTPTVEVCSDAGIVHESDWRDVIKSPVMSCDTSELSVVDTPLGANDGSRLLSPVSAIDTSTSELDGFDLTANDTIWDPLCFPSVIGSVQFEPSCVHIGLGVHNPIADGFMDYGYLMNGMNAQYVAPLNAVRAIQNWLPEPQTLEPRLLHI